MPFAALETSPRKSGCRPVPDLNHDPKLREVIEYSRAVDNTLLVNRRTTWGNRFEDHAALSPAEAAARYRCDLWRCIRTGESSLEEFAGLDGCWLACRWDHPCHGDVLARAAAWAGQVLAERGNPVTGRYADRSCRRGFRVSSRPPCRAKPSTGPKEGKECAPLRWVPQ